MRGDGAQPGGSGNSWRLRPPRCGGRICHKCACFSKIKSGASLELGLNRRGIGPLVRSIWVDMPAIIIYLVSIRKWWISARAKAAVISHAAGKSTLRMAKSENAGMGRKMPFMDGHYLAGHSP